ncbi:hypothetical protein DOY81_008688 [Sarcophaga bullata]|nr:hypothetical protein DOY81_008688 [Sarcophaga bullata]
MTLTTAKFIYTNSVIECEREFKTNSIVGKAAADTSTFILLPKTASYKCILKYNKIYNNKTCCTPTNDELERGGEYLIGAINNKRLGLIWRKQTNFQRRKRHLLHSERIKTENINSYSCLFTDQQRFFTPRIPITPLDIQQQKLKQLNCSSVSNTNCCSIISKKFSMHDNSSTSNIRYATTKFVENNAQNRIVINADNSNKGKISLCAKRLKLQRWRHHKHRTRIFDSILNYVRLIMACSYFQQYNYKSFHILFVILLTLTQYLSPIQGLLVSKSSSGVVGLNLAPTDFENTSDILVYNSNGGNSASNNNSINNRLFKNAYNLEHDDVERGDLYLPASKSFIITSSTEGGTSNGAYLDKLDNLERSLAAVLIKVAYGTTSTTKRSIPENSYVPSLTTIATPLLTTLRYQEKSHQSQLNIHHRNYELDLERDHALPTSAPNADILKSNSNPTYPNPNRHHNHERDRHRHLINSTPKPSLPNILKKASAQIPTISLFPGGSIGDIPSYSPPARSFFTPPLPPEYQHPFADKPTLRGTNNEGGIEPNTGSYINRRPIPPPSLMPGHERIPLRPPDLGGTSNSNNDGISSSGLIPSLSGTTSAPIYALTTAITHRSEIDAKKALNTPSKVLGDGVSNVDAINTPSSSSGIFLDSNSNLYNNSNNLEVRKEVLPSIRRILSGSNGRKGDIPEVLLKQVTTRPNSNYHHPPSSPVVLINSSLLATNEGSVETVDKQNINKIKNMRDSEVSDDDDRQQKSKITTKPWGESNLTSTPSAAAAIGNSGDKIKTAMSATSTTASSGHLDISQSENKNNMDNSSPSSSSSSTSSISSSTSTSTLSSASAHATWSLAWNIHVYLSVILFTILAVYSFYKIITYNKLTHLFSQSYFICIHLILIIICTARTFYLCYDAYNIHSSFHIFISEILLNLPATFLTISFAVLILFLSLKSLNHKNNRYSALIRPLTVVVGCGVHVVLCITLHYVESYTLQNHQQHLYYQQQQQLLTKRQQMQQQHQQNLHYNYLQNQYYAANIVGLETMAFSSSVASVQGANFHQNNIATSVSSLPPPPPRVLSLICQIIYIFVCFSLGLLYLYLYRILKRILRSKSQNYIHGYQNLSYAIHITIATALLFVLLASLQIFGAISISSSRPLITQKTAEIDWLQWGYQFSLRLIEIAIITLISWVTGLKTSNGNNTVNINLTNNETRVVSGQVNGGNSMFNTNLNVNPGREKHSVHHNNQYNHTNMTNFFLPCTSSSSQEQFDTDYPAVCNTNTNLHTYTMRTGKLIYDDSFALSSLTANSAAPLPNDFHNSHPQTQSHHQQHLKQQIQATYQHPYDSQSLHSSAHHNVSEYGSRINYQPEKHLQYNDYLTDNTTDHYENPNFDLRGSGSATSGSALVVSSGAGNGTMQKFAKNSISNSITTASSSNNSNMGSNSSSGSSATLQQQMLLLQGGGETCYSEPIHENYDFNNFEKPKFKQQPHDNWPDAHIPTLLSKRDKKKSLTTLERCGYDKPERRSSNSTHSCNSNTNSNSAAGSNNASNGVMCNSGGNGSTRYASFNTFERAPFNNVRKSDTFNNITSNGHNIVHGRNNSSSSATSATSVSGSRNTPLGIQTLATAERHYHHQAIPSRNMRSSGSSKVLGNNATGLDVFSRSTIERSSISHTQQKSLNQPNTNQSQAHLHQYSDDEEDNNDDDIMLAGDINFTTQELLIIPSHVATNNIWSYGA